MRPSVRCLRSAAIFERGLGIDEIVTLPLQLPADPEPARRT